MLSIVKMEIDSDMDLLEERPNKSDEIDITEGPNRALYYRNASSNEFDKLQMIPIVYTTRLEDMTTLQYTSYPIRADPSDVSTRILKQSKPILRKLPIKKRRRYKKRFYEMKAYLEKIYTPINIEDNPASAIAELSRKLKEELLNIPAKQIEHHSVKSKVLNESNSENTKPNTCKYSDLLKLCKPCSVVLPGIGSYAGNAVIHGGQVLQVNKVKKPILGTLLRESSSDEEQPLITLCPELLETRNPTEQIGTNQKQNSAENENVSNRLQNILPVNAAHIAPRLMRNSVLELVDKFSKEYSMYFMDNDSNLLDYFKDTTDKTYLHQDYSRSRHLLVNCCWVKKDETLQQLYPKVLIYPNSRFMRKPHPCKHGACVCCCRKTENIEKPNLVVLEHPSASSNRKTLDKEDLEIQDLEDKIQKSIININKTPKLNSSEWLRRLLTPINSRDQPKKTLIVRALNYTKPQPKEPKDNRCLVTLKKCDLQNLVLVLRNFAMDVTEIYEINSDSNIETSIVTTCYNNTSRRDIKKLLKNPNAINETVCCWYKREAVITKLKNIKNLLSSAAIMFIRSNHACPTNECTCCCKPKPIKNTMLKDIKLPSRTNWSTTLNPLKSAQDFQPQLVSSFSLATESQSTKFQLEPPPLVPLSSQSQSSTSQDEDCQITSVIASPSLRPIPQNPIVTTLPTVPAEAKVATVTVPAGPTNIMVTDVVDSEEMSQEVNSLITSILDRFKDVRLTINSDGKVAAALNTPVNTLSTVELKVLANILSFAQSQVNLLGAKSNVNSGMSLSNIINLKVDDVQNSTLDPNVVYKAFGKNGNGNKKSQSSSQPNNAKNVPFNFPPIAPHPTPPQTYAFFTSSTSFRNQHFNEAFSSFIATKIHPEHPTETATPVIESVYSLNKAADETKSTSTTVWYREPVPQPSVSTLSENTIKTYSNNSQKRKDSEPSFTNPKKIKVISPSKLGATATDVSENTAIAHNSMQQTVSVGGFLPVVPLLSNNNFQIITSPQTEPSFNTTPPTTTSQPILIINPLDTLNLMNTGSTLSVPFTNNSLNDQNVMSISHPQPIIPLPVNTNMSQVVTHSTNVPVAQAITSVAAKPELPEAVDAEEHVNNELDENSGSTITADLDTKLEYSEEEREEENYEENWPGMENCDAEEDCILGF